MGLPLAKIKVVTDGGPWADHNFPCPVCQEKPAVLELGYGRYSPCWACQDKGWRLSRRRRWWHRG